MRGSREGEREKGREGRSMMRRGKCGGERREGERGDVENKMKGERGEVDDEEGGREREEGRTRKKRGWEWGKGEGEERSQM